MRAANRVRLEWGDFWERGNIMGSSFALRGQWSPFWRGMKAQPLTLSGFVAAVHGQGKAGDAARWKGLKLPALAQVALIPRVPGRVEGFPQIPLGFGWSPRGLTSSC